MSYLSSKVLLGTATLMVSATIAEAQMTPGGPMGGGMGGPQQPAGEELPLQPAPEAVSSEPQ